MSPNIPGNVVKHSGKCPQTFRGMSSNIPGNVTKDSGECPQRKIGYKKLYAKQRNYCVSLRKTKKAYYENLHERKVSDNKLFWKTVKPSLSKKFNTRERISLTENGKLVKTEKETAEVFNNFFGNIVKNLNISQYSDFDPIIENVKDPTLKSYS